MKKRILGASIGNCVHVAGVAHFLDLAEQEGYETIFLGPAVSIDVLYENVYKYKPDIIGISYRLTPENVKPLLEEIFRRAEKLDYTPKWVFGGTHPVAEYAKKFPQFSFISDGYDDINDSIRFLRGGGNLSIVEQYRTTLKERIESSFPYPILRHHFGLPDLEQTIQGVRKIAEAKVLDVISLGPDQNAQQFFFHPEKMDSQYNGAGGVPVRTEEDFRRLKEASQCGNYPLMRCYSGTEDVFQYAQMLVDTIDNAWTAVPLFWYSELDGRGTRPIEVSIKEAQQLMRWHAERGIPVEVNEPHHWGLRDAHDVIPVAAAYLSAYNAKKQGVRDYVAQFMFNNPNGLSFSMDFAKILAMIEMAESLADDNFRVYRETRAGLPLFSADAAVAKGQLAASTFMQMAVKPHIVHVVGFCEADHAAAPEDVIESCKIARGVIRHTFSENFSMEKDKRILQRKNELISEAKLLLDFIENRFSEYDDPLANPIVLAECVKRGYLDAVHIMKNEKFKGNLHTKFLNGKCVAFDKAEGKALSEAERLKGLVKREQALSEEENHEQKLFNSRRRPSGTGDGGALKSVR